MSSTTRQPSVRTVAAVAAALLAAPVGLFVAGGTAAADGAGAVDVYPSGGAPAIQAAVNAATPGTTIRIHQGTYDGAIRVARSGTVTAPITLTSAGDGPVTLTANLPKPACSAGAPAQQRTIVFTNGADDWTVQGLTIVGGVIGVGAGAQQVLNWNRALVASGDWATRRAIPGRGVNDPSAAAAAVSAMATRLGRALDPVDRIRILGNDISGMGVQMSMARWGSVVGNSIHDIACGTGPGVWLGNLSDGWTVTRNHIWNIAAATQHYMYEGIRVANASDYNVVSDNLVEHIPSDGRAFTTDEDASWNVFSDDVARDVNVGFNDEMSGWGNVWTHDTSVDHRNVGFQFRALDAKLAQPSMNSSTRLASVTCNVAAVTGRWDLYAGGIEESTFRGNTFGTVKLAATVRSYWVAQGNTWDGVGVVPPDHPPKALAGC